MGTGSTTKQIAAKAIAAGGYLPEGIVSKTEHFPGRQPETQKSAFP